MAKRHALTDRQWKRIEHLFEEKPRRGRPWRDHRTMIDGMLWILKTGAPWRDLPERFGPWQTVFDRFNRWRKDGTFDRIVAHLQRDLDREGQIDWSAFCIDATSVRASRSASGAAKKGIQTLLPTARSSQTRTRASRRIMRWGGLVAVLRPRFTSSATPAHSRSR